MLWCVQRNGGGKWQRLFSSSREGRQTLTIKRIAPFRIGYKSLPSAITSFPLTLILFISILVFPATLQVKEKKTETSSPTQMVPRDHGDSSSERSNRKPALTVNDREQANRSSASTIADDQPPSSSSTTQTQPPRSEFDMVSGLVKNLVTNHYPLHTLVIRPRVPAVNVDWASSAQVGDIIADLITEGWVIDQGICDSI